MKYTVSSDGLTSKDAAIVYVIDDDASMREAVEALLQSVGFNVEKFSCTEDFLACDNPDQPACLVVDVRLRGQSGLALQEHHVMGGLRIPIVFMTAHGDIAMSVRAMKAGAIDFLTKPFRDQDMLDAVSRAVEMDARRRCTDRSNDELRRCYASMTPREREVTSLVGRGLCDKQIAADLHVSEITVRIHRNHAMKKLGSLSLADFALSVRVLLDS
jgi:FixJ family two-component response regulator